MCVCVFVRACVCVHVSVCVCVLWCNRYAAKIVVGATPPPAATVGNASLEVADRFADFLRAHPSVAGLPDLIVVSYSCWYSSRWPDRFKAAWHNAKRP